MNPVIFASQEQLNSWTAVYPRQTSLDSEKIKNDEMLQHLVSTFALGEREQDKKEEEIEQEGSRSVGSQTELQDISSGKKS